MNRQLAATILLALALGSESCKSTAPEAADGTRDTAALEGRWEGSFYQYGLEQAYPMVLTAERTSPEDMSVQLDWPAQWESRTRGVAFALEPKLVAWSEEELVRGANIALGGTYWAAFVGPDTLAGVYHHDIHGDGFFSLSRTGPEVREAVGMAARRTR